MQRRQFLTFTGLGLAATVFGSSCASSRRSAVTLDVVSQARALGKPLLVFVVPESDERRWEHETILGSYLNNASETHLAELAMCELVCAKQSELAPHVTPVRSKRGEPLVLVVEPDATVLTIHADELQAVGNPWDTDLEKHEAELRARIDTMSELVRRAIGATPEGTVRRADDVATRLTNDEIDTLRSRAARPESLSDDLARHGAAVLLLAAARDASLAPAIATRLARLTHERWIAGPPPGAAWASSTGCGTEIEGEENDESACVACGMAFTPAIAARFLHFYADPSGA